MAPAAGLRRDPVPLRDHVVLTLWTADRRVAAVAHRSGVDRVGVDLERIGKLERQRGLGTWISPHAIEDLAALTGTGARLFARVNPLHPGSRRETEALIGAGAEVLMLPMVERARDAERFVAIVNGRAEVVLLAETADALRALPELARVDGVGEVHVGINDLALSLGLRNRWLVLAGDVAARAGEVVCSAGLRFGLGGIGRAHDDGLPVPADLVYAELARTGATATLLARSFLGGDLASEVGRARRRLAEWQAASPEALGDAHAQLGRAAEQAPSF